MATIDISEDYEHGYDLGETISCADNDSSLALRSWGPEGTCHYGKKEMIDDYVENPTDPGETKEIPTAPITTSWWRDYIHDGRIVELVACVCFFVFSNILPWQSWFGLKLFQRPIPYFLVSDGDYIRNLAENEVFNGDTVPFQLLIIIAAILPLTLQLVLSCVLNKKTKALQLVHRTVCAYLISWTINMIAVDFVKTYVGYLRPIFYDVCHPDNDYSTCKASTTEPVRKSFPSGHAATAFCGMTLLSSYIHTRFGVSGYKRERKLAAMSEQQSGGTTNTTGTKEEIVESSELRFARFVSLLAFIPLGVALWIAASRVRDNQHFPADVTTGGIIGFGVAHYVHGLWFIE